MSTEATIWHYPRCSKSRKTLAMLRDEELDVTVRHYRDDPPDFDTLAGAIERLAISPQELVRKKDSYFKDLDVDEAELDDRDWTQLMVDHPQIIERPVVFIGDEAVLGRPPERIYELLLDDQ